MAASYGLTLVAGLPLPAAIGARLQAVQAQVEANVPGRFYWYDPTYFHITLYAPLRGRYRDHPPLQRDELPADLDAFTADLCHLFAHLQPFPLLLTGVRFTDGGYIAASVRDGHGLQQQIASAFARHPELNHPNYFGDLHITLGYLNAPCEALTQTEIDFLGTDFGAVMSRPIGEVLVDKVWLVHYTNRTLRHLQGKIPFVLGQVCAITPQLLLGALGIAEQSAFA